MTDPASVPPLGVDLRGRTIGQLRADETGVLSFAYAPDWLADGEASPISLSLPLRAEEFRGGAGHAFFANLLPEGAVRQAVCRRLGLSVDNDYALLRAIGGDCAGALTIVDPDAPRRPADDQMYEALPARRIQELVDEEDALPLLIDGEETRLSLAGAQDKLPVALLDGVLQLPHRGAPSTYILKLPQRRYAHMTCNEAFVSGLAGEIGLSVSAAQLYRETEPPCLLIQRYDRRPSDDPWPAVRLHQEDLCQALGLPPSRKYEQEGGPSLARAIELVRAHGTEPLLDVRRLVEWQAFNLVAGNADGHGKNLSFLHADRGSLRLAPFYDLVSTRHYRGLDRNLAMSVGGRRRPDEIGRTQWEALGAEAGIAARTVRALVRGVAERCADGIGAWRRAFQDCHGARPILQTLPRAIQRRAVRVRDDLA